MKRFIALLVAVLMVASMAVFFVACGDDETTTAAVTPPPNGSNGNDGNDNNGNGNDGNDLVVDPGPGGPDFVVMQNFVALDGFELRTDDWHTVGAGRAPGPNGRFNLQMPIWFDGEYAHQFVEFLNFDWYIWVRRLDESTMVFDTSIGGGWERIRAHVDSSFTFGDNRGFRFMTHILQDENGNRTWNNDAFDFQIGNEYEYRISIYADGQHVLTSYSLSFTFTTVSETAVDLYTELYQLTGLGRNIPEVGQNVMDERMIFFFANFDRFIVADGGLRYTRPPSDWDPTGMPGWVGWDAVVDLGFVPGDTPVDTDAPWYTAPAVPAA